MQVLLAALCGFVLDALLGDPAWMPHPVVYMGKAISALEKSLRRRFPATPQGELRAGAVLAFLLPVGTFCLSAGIIWLLYRVFPPLAFLAQVIWSWQVLAARCLEQESTNVYRTLKGDSLQAAQQAVGRIVGRDVARLDEAGVARAAVETVAENFSDGEAAPLLYLLLGGAPLALAYKAVNTMDSMVGYKNEKYLFFGRAAAKLDDVVNWLPARLAAMLLVAAAALCGENAAGAFAVWKRDRRKHASPNSAQTEAAMAGALGLQLAGPAWYFGERHDKQYIGDPVRPIEPEDILRANKLMWAATLFCFLLLAVLRFLLLGA